MDLEPKGKPVGIQLLERIKPLGTHGAVLPQSLTHYVPIITLFLPFHHFTLLKALFKTPHQVAHHQITFPIWENLLANLRSCVKFSHQNHTPHCTLGNSHSPRIRILGLGSVSVTLHVRVTPRSHQALTL